MKFLSWFFYVYQTIQGMKKLFFFNLLMIFLCFTSVLQAQEMLVKGKIVDHNSGAEIPGVAIYDSISGIGTLSSFDGTFLIKLQSEVSLLWLSHISYKSIKIKIETNKKKIVNLGLIQLQTQSLELNAVNVISSFVTDRNTPLAFSTIQSRKIEQKIGNQDYPEVLKFTPGIYASSEGGGNGDSRLSLRGFQQENVAILLNGVPVSSMENGLVYWSNWAGLADATEAIQVQRGLGASRVAMNSVGGTINIITKPVSVKQGGFLRYSMADFGNQKTTLSFSTGKLKNNTAFTFLGSRTVGPGLVDATYVNGWSYFLNFSYEPNSRNRFIFTAMGSPEKHGQRNYPMSIADFEKYGVKYNANWGEYKSEVFNLSENFYHKPQISATHYYTMSPKAVLATSVYVSFGYGGGRYTETFNYGNSTWSFRKNNQIDFDAIFENNSTHDDSVMLQDGSSVKGYSKNILTHYRANHYWAGVASSLTYDINTSLKLISGIHFRRFKSHLFEEINDLMGGSFWVDQYAWSPSGVAGRKQIKYVGDQINVNNYSTISYSNFFGQLEYNVNSITSFLAASISGTGFRREDPQNYLVNPLSDLVLRSGFDIKSGINYKLGEKGKYGHLFANIGFYSKEPYYKFIFVNYSNAVANGIKNEKILGTELGYIYDNQFINLSVNCYNTLWRDKSMLTYENIQLNDTMLVRSNVTGLAALHKGIEIEFTWKLTYGIQFGSVASLGDWRWSSDAEAEFTNDNEVLVAKKPIYVKGLYVGDAPQTQLGFLFEYNSTAGIVFAADYLWYDRLFANFDPSTRTNASDQAQSYALPAYSMLDLMAEYSFVAKQFPIKLQINCQNVFDKEVITRGDDGVMHDASTFRGYWSTGRTFNISAKIEF